MGPVNYVTHERDGRTNQNDHPDLMERTEEYSVNEETQEMNLCDFL